MTWFTKKKEPEKDVTELECPIVTRAKLEFVRLQKEMEPLYEKLSVKAKVELQLLADKVEAIEGFGGAIHYADLIRSGNPSNLRYEKKTFYNDGYVKMFLHKPRQSHHRSSILAHESFQTDQRLFETRIKRAIMLPWWVDNFLIEKEEPESILRSLPSGWFETEECNQILGELFKIKRKIGDCRALIPIGDRVGLY